MKIPRILKLFEGVDYSIGQEIKVTPSTAPAAVLDRAAWDGIPDEEVIERIRAGDTKLYEILMRRYNQRL